MAASANPSGNEQQESFNGGSGGGGSGGGGANASNGNAGGGAGGENGASGAALKHNPGIATEWSTEEQEILDDGLKKHASVTLVVRYAKIAMQLPNKTARDVAFRCRWMHKKEMSKRRKDERKSKDKREKVTDSSGKASQPSPRPTVQPYSLPTMSQPKAKRIECDTVILLFSDIGGPVGELLEQNAQTFEQISANFSSHQIQENINLLCQARENITKILNSLSETPEIMKQMPPLPVKLNEELANSMLPHRQS
ncbi:hypothetical protein AKJ16_DCAP18470 [Drosera capensis]